jgi:hypothetical protein
VPKCLLASATNWFRQNFLCPYGCTREAAEAALGRPCARCAWRGG